MTVACCSSSFQLVYVAVTHYSFITSKKDHYFKQNLFFLHVDCVGNRCAALQYVSFTITAIDLCVILSNIF